jgi:hypothetical protein
MTPGNVLLPSRLAASTVIGVMAVARTDPLTTVTLGHPGACGDHPTLVTVIADDSLSVTSIAGADPVSNRYEEARLAFRAVARQCRCGQCFGAVVHFDLVGGVKPTRLRKRGVAAIEPALRLPLCAAGTSLLEPSLDAAMDIAAEFPEHQRTLVVCSDFAMADPDPVVVIDKLAAYPGDVHALVLGARGAEIGTIDARIRVTPVSPNDPPGALARAVFASLITHRKGAHPTA